MRPTLRDKVDLGQQRLRGQLAQVVGRQRAIAGNQLAVLVALAADALVQHLHTQIPQARRQWPTQLARHIADIHVGTLVQRVGEHADLVALIDIVVGAFAQRRCQHAGGAMAQRNDVLVFGHRPLQQCFYFQAVRNAHQRTVPARHKHCDIRRIVVQVFCHHIRQFARLLELGAVLLIGGSHRFVFCRHRPHLEFHRVAGQGGHLDIETGAIQVVHRQQGFYRVVAGRKHGAVLHQHVALVGSHHQHFPLFASVGLRVNRAVKVGLGGGIQAERVR